MNNNKNFKDMLLELEEINRWFQDDDIDLDEGLKKLQEGRNLINECKNRLKHVENEFTKIAKEISTDTDNVDTENLQSKEFEESSQSDDIKIEEDSSNELPF